MPAKPETVKVWRVIKKYLLELDPQRIESDCTPAFPDVEYVGGTVELKYEKAWPKRPTTNLNVKSLTKNPKQRVWWKRRARKGGRVFVLLRVADDWLLFHGVDAAEFLCYSTQSQLLEIAIKCWGKKLKGEELCLILKSHRAKN